MGMGGWTLLAIALVGLGLTALGLRRAWRASAALPKLAPPPENGWLNWGRNQTATPARKLQPETVDALRDAVTSSDSSIRVVGAGHSFTELVPTEGTLINLDQMGGVLSTDADRATAWVRAGARLKDLSPELERRGLAFRNLGDINVQSLAGATSTATHGTGKTLPCLSAEIQAVRLMTASGEMMTISADENADMLPAVQVALGALGIIVDAEVSLVAPYRLHRKTWTEPVAESLSNSMARWDALRNYEFMYVPFSDHSICISHEETDAEITPRRESDDDGAVMGLKQMRDFNRWTPKLRRSMISDAFSKVRGEDVVGDSWRLLATPRNVPFKEMEYHLPPEGALDVVAEVIDIIETKHRHVFFPIEVRQTAGDTAWLSPFQGGPRISVAVHAYYADSHDWFFTDIEPVFRRVGGRPHWGKLHSLGHAELTDLYPDFEKFLAVRKRIDPDGTFMTPYLAKLWGEAVS